VKKICWREFQKKNQVAILVKIIRSNCILLCPKMEKQCKFKVILNNYWWIYIKIMRSSLFTKPATTRTNRSSLSRPTTIPIFPLSATRQPPSKSQADLPPIFPLSQQISSLSRPTTVTTFPLTDPQPPSLPTQRWCVCLYFLFMYVLEW
jgi:hypothetical protein